MTGPGFQAGRMLTSPQAQYKRLTRESFVGSGGCSHHLTNRGHTTQCIGFAHCRVSNVCGEVLELPKGQGGNVYSYSRAEAPPGAAARDGGHNVREPCTVPPSPYREAFLPKKSSRRVVYCIESPTPGDVRRPAHAQSGAPLVRFRASQSIPGRQHHTSASKCVARASGEEENWRVGVAGEDQ